MARLRCPSRRGFEPWRSPVGISLFLYYTLFSDVLVSVNDPGPEYLLKFAKS